MITHSGSIPHPSNRTGHTLRIAAAIAPTAFIALLATILFRYPPAQNAFYPRCPIYTYLHLLCPGCGTTRAYAALLHGHLLEALRLNALTTLLLPFAIFYILRSSWQLLTRRTFTWPQIPNPALYALLLITAAFTILRNLS